MRGVKTKGGNKWKKFGIFLVLVLALLLLLNSAHGVYQKKKNAEEVLSRTKEQVKVLIEKEVALKASLERLATTEGLKSEIRRKLNVAEVGESVAVIVAEEKTPSLETLEISTWQKLKDLFGELFK